MVKKIQKILIILILMLSAILATQKTYASVDENGWLSEGTFSSGEFYPGFGSTLLCGMHHADYPSIGGPRTIGCDNYEQYVLCAIGMDNIVAYGESSPVQNAWWGYNGRGGHNYVDFIEEEAYRYVEFCNDIENFKREHDDNLVTFDKSEAKIEYLKEKNKYLIGPFSLNYLQRNSTSEEQIVNITVKPGNRPRNDNNYGNETDRIYYESDLMGGRENELTEGSHEIITIRKESYIW